MKGLIARWRLLLLLTGLAAVAAHWFMVALHPSGGIDEKSYLTLVFPEAFDFSEKGGRPLHYKALTLDEKGGQTAIGAVFKSTEVSPGIRGYAGPVPVLLGIDREGTITGLLLMEHNETPSYAAGVESRDFLKQFEGKKVTDPLQLEEDIDGVTRATVTARAVTDGVRISARLAAGSLYGLATPAEKAPPPLPLDRLAALALLCAAALLSSATKNSALRWTSLLLGLGLLGYWQGTYLSSATFANLLLWRLPAFREHFFWYALLAAALLPALTWKNVYCSRMCPFGALQEIIHRLSPGRLDPSRDDEREARNLRYIFLWLVTVAVFAFGRTEAANYEPFSTVFDFKGGVVQWLLLATVLFISAFRHRFWCRYFCPTGVCLQLLGKMRSSNPFD